MRLLVSGSSGFVGSFVCQYLKSQGHEVVALSRNLKSFLLWECKESMEGFDGVIHLAGERLTLQRWTEKKKEKILQSRLDGTVKLVEILAKLQRPPKVFISASAIGIYGDRGEELLDETSPKGQGFLADVCAQWESASLPLAKKGIRTVQTRFGIVLGQGGGALETLLPIYRHGLGAILGSGKQWVSWVSLNDLARSLAWILEKEISGPVNLVSPNPIRQVTFAKALGRAVHRPVLWKIPAWILRLLFKEMAEGMLLASARAVPSKLLKSGFSFHSLLLASVL